MRPSVHPAHPAAAAATESRQLIKQRTVNVGLLLSTGEELSLIMWSFLLTFSQNVIHKRNLLSPSLPPSLFLSLSFYCMDCNN